MNEEPTAILQERLRALCLKVPPSIRNGSVNATRQWKDDQVKSLKICSSKRATAQEIQAAITKMRAYL